MKARRRIALVHGVPLGVGGLGIQAGNAVRALARDHEVHAIGPGAASNWPAPQGLVCHPSPRSWEGLHRLRTLRRHAGMLQHLADRDIGRFAARRLNGIKPDLCYAFTQVARDTLAWARTHSVPGVLESPNGHIRSFRQVYVDEASRWCSGWYLGHPTARMVERVEREYALASHIRVSSEWSSRSLTEGGGVNVAPISVLQQPVDLSAFRPIDKVKESLGPLRVCVVGTLDLRKGFIYLLRALRRLDTPVAIEFVGGTGDRCCRALLERERQGLDVSVAPGDPRPALGRADVFVLPTLEDGSPFAIAEAMASGVPVITTTATGAAEWIRHEESGWVVPAASDEALASALSRALARRTALPDMGRAARESTARRIEGADELLGQWIRAL